MLKSHQFTNSPFGCKWIYMKRLIICVHNPADCPPGNDIKSSPGRHCRMQLAARPHRTQMRASSHAHAFLSIDHPLVMTSTVLWPIVSWLHGAAIAFIVYLKPCCWLDAVSRRRPVYVPTQVNWAISIILHVGRALHWVDFSYRLRHLVADNWISWSIIGYNPTVCNCLLSFM